MFNAITGDVVCDGATGTCADFVSEVDALTDEGKSKMIKSIFGCNDEDPPQPVALEVAQKRFDKIKNDESVTKALLAIVEENTKLFTGSASVVTNACNGSCCRDSNSCTIDSANGGVMTVSSESCVGDQACRFTRPNAIILDSCKGLGACFRLGNFFPNHPAAGVKVGSRVIGPRACVEQQSCNGVGANIFGDIRVQEGACDTMNSCTAISSRANQGSTTTTPIVARVFIGKNACQGSFTCFELHSRSSIKFAGSVIVEAGACPGEQTCLRLGKSDSATNDIIIRAGVCKPAATCKNCVQGPLCTSANETYVIDNAAADCPGPSLSACEFL